MTAERCLIINADDYNTDAERSRGIVEAAARGIVTSASALTTSPGLAVALDELAGVLGPRIGVHLNLTNGRPLSKGLRSLTGPGGDFLPKGAAWRRALARGYDLGELRHEWSAQIEAFFDAGREPDHLDGNNHVHVFPGCVRVCAELARKYDIRRVRLPLEPPLAPGLWGPGGAKRAFIGLLAARARGVFRSCGLGMPDRMYGIAWPAAGNAAALCRFLRTLPCGTTELMCHPGYAAPGTQPFSNAARIRELRALTRPEVRETLADRNIRLVSFSDIA